MQGMRQNTRLAAVVLMSLAVAFDGCGGGSAPLTTPGEQNASVAGPYNLVLTSTSGQGTADIYTNFTQTGTMLAGSADTLVCPSNDVSLCKGGDAQRAAVAPSGVVSGTHVTILISFPSAAGDDTITMIGSAGGISLAGTYTDMLGDSGTWTASAAGPLSGNYSGTFNSISNPLPIAPTILMTLAQDASFHLTGTAMIMGSPCIGSLALTGQAIGGAFSLIDAANKVHIIALPTDSGFTFSYNFDPTAPSCAADYGRGMVTNQDPWGY